MTCDQTLMFEAIKKLNSADDRIRTNELIKKGDFSPSLGGLFSLNSIYNGVTLETGKKTHLI